MCGNPCQKHQIPITNRIGFGDLKIGVWSLFGVWALRFEISNLKANVALG